MPRKLQWLSAHLVSTTCCGWTAMPRKLQSGRQRRKPSGCCGWTAMPRKLQWVDYQTWADQVAVGPRCPESYNRWHQWRMEPCVAVGPRCPESYNEAADTLTDNAVAVGPRCPESYNPSSVRAWFYKAYSDDGWGKRRDRLVKIAPTDWGSCWALGVSVRGTRQCARTVCR